MRKVGLLASALSMALFACTAILGDFSVGDGGTTDGGNEGGSDVSSDGPDAGDAGSDVQTVKLATCTLDTTKPTVFNFPSQGTIIDDGDRVLVFQFQTRNRLFIGHNNLIYYADFSDNDQSVQLSLFAGSGRILGSTHVNGPTPGTVFITWDYNANGFGYIKWLDVQGQAPTIGSTLVDSVKMGGVPLGSWPMKGTITAIDLQNDDLLFAVEYTFDAQGQTFQFATGHFRAGSLVGFVVLDQNQGPDLSSQTISHDQSSAYFWVSPGSSGGAPSGPAPLYIMDIANWSKASVVQYQPQTGFYVPFSVSNGGPGNTDIAFLEGDLANQNAIPFMHTQSVLTSTLGSFKPQNIPGGQVPIAGLPFNKGVAHWSSYATEDEWIGAGRPLGNGVPGANIVWFDSKGNARAIVQDTDGAGGFPSVPVNSIDMTLSGPPTLVFSGIRAAWIEGQGQLQDPKVISLAGNCSTL